MDDYESIRQLTARYNHASDNEDWDTWLHCFTETGSFRRSNDSRSFEGWAELRDLPGRIPVSARHITTDFVITVDGEKAHQRCYLLFLDREADFRVAMFGVYEDDLVKADGQWLFQTRLLKVDVGSGGDPDWARPDEPETSTESSTS